MKPDDTIKNAEDLKKTKGLPPQLFDKHFLGYLKCLELQAKLELGEHFGEGLNISDYEFFLREKMIEIEEANL